MRSRPESKEVEVVLMAYASASQQPQPPLRWLLLRVTRALYVYRPSSRPDCRWMDGTNALLEMVQPVRKLMWIRFDASSGRNWSPSVNRLRRCLACLMLVW